MLLSKTTIVNTVSDEATLSVHLHGGKIQKYLLQLGLRDHVVLDWEALLVGLHNGKYAWQRDARVGLDVHVNEAISVLLNLAVSERGENKVDEAFDFLGLRGLAQHWDLGQQGVALAVFGLQVLQASQTL